MTLTSGTTQDGTWTGTVTLPQGAAPGRWYLWIYPVNDTLGNRQNDYTILKWVTATVGDLEAGTPTVAGVAQVGRTLTADPGTWGPAPVDLTYQWTRDGQNIPDATSATYQLTRADRDHAIAVVVTGARDGYTTTSATSAPTDNVAPDVPAAPGNIEATRGDRSAQVSWGAAADNGSPITNYTIVSTPGGKTVTVPGDKTSAVVSGLTNGETYYFTVQATNAIDTSPASKASSEITPQAVLPATAIIGGPSNGSYALGTSAAFGYTSSEPDSSFICTLDGSVHDCGPSTVSFSTLTQTTHRFTVAARDGDGDVDPTPATRVWTVPRNNSTLIHSSGWSRKSGAGYYLRTYSETTKRGAELRARVSGVRKLSLVATKGRDFGTVKVYLGSTLLKRVGLGSSTLHKRQVVPIASFAHGKSGTVRIVVVSVKRTVRIEGLGVATR